MARRIPRGAGITLYQSDYGTYEIVDDSEEQSILVQTDYSFPSTAMTFGWRPKKFKGCAHRHTDGTIDCPDCGKKVGAFISEAADYLDRHIGKRVEDPGYFE